MTQEQILSVAAIALVFGAFLLTLAIAFVRRRRAASDVARSAAAARGVLAGPAASGNAPGGSSATVSSGTPRTSAGGNGNAGHNGGSSPATNAAPPIPGIEDPILWTRVTDAEVARITRYHRAATIVLFQIDGLDRLTATLGREAGERIVAATAGTIRAEARATDTVSRLGPDRFGALLPETDEVAAINYIERVRAICDRWLEAGAVSVRLAIGWARLTSELGPAGTMRLSEHRLDQERRVLSRRETTA